MGKKSSSATAIQGSSQNAASSAIDDIFAKPSAAKAATPATQPIASSSKASLLSHASAANKPKKKKKAKAIATFDPENEDEPAAAAPASTSKIEVKGKSKTDGSGAPSRAVEVVEDPSLAQIAAAVQAAKVKASATAESSGKVKKRPQPADEEDEMFRDSRGTGPRRKTEEGFLIYKEAELSIDPTAGGTPLCPFDCDCCF